MASLNVPVPGAVRREIEALRPRLTDFEAVRETPTLVLKRFDGERSTHAIESEVRHAVADTGPFDVRLAGLETFEDPVAGPGPVLYLAIESPGLRRLHRRLIDRFGAVDGLEGEAYVPHITVARGGDVAGLAELTEASVAPVEWSVAELWVWDPHRAERLGRIELST
ncbi:MAG: 2'-5' RNA ligase family protein [Halobacteriales archaeon]